MSSSPESPARPPFRQSDVRAYAAPLGVVLLLLAVVAAALTWEAWSAERSHRATAQSALNDYALFAASRYSDEAFVSMYLGSQAILAPVGSSSMVSELDRVHDPSEILQAAKASHDCKCRWDADPDYAYSYRPSDQTVVIRGPRPPNPMLQQRLLDSLTANFDTMTTREHLAYPRSEQLYVSTDTVDGGQMHLLTFKYGAPGVPTMVYGFEAPLKHYTERVLPRVMQMQLLPKAVTRRLTNDSLFTVTVRDANGDLLYASGVARDTSYSARVPLWRFATDGPVVQIAIRPEAAALLINGGVPSSRLPLLVALLVLACVLVLAALLLSRRAQELAELRSDFTSSVSHELRTPLAQILLFAETLHLGRAGTPGERDSAMRIILREARRLAHLVDNVLLFSRTEHRTKKISPLPLPLAPLVRDVANSFAPLARVHEMEVETTLDESVVAPIDPGALRQILLNLLDNAAKYGPHGQTITVGLALDGADARVWVDDEGPGVPQQDRERVWQAFVRAHRTGEFSCTGSGIGLAVVKQLADLHSARCWVGTAPSGGARFVLELPGASSAADERPPRRGAGASGSETSVAQQAGD
jgi:signal transduction histidine kinase